MGLVDIVGKGKADMGLVVRLEMAMEEKERMEKVVAAAAKGRRTQRGSEIFPMTVSHSDVHTRYCSFEVA